jgi:acetyl-CoA acetyltransferase
MWAQPLLPRRITPTPADSDNSRHPLSSALSPRGQSMTHPMNSATAISGLGITKMGRVYRSAPDLAAEAVMLALDDAGLDKSDVDGLLVNAGIRPDVGLQLHVSLGLAELNLLTFMQGYGSSAGQMIQYAAMAVANGLANTVACVFADAPLREGQRTGASYARGGGSDALGALHGLYGFVGANASFAMAAQRHMGLYGTTSDQLGQIAIGQRQWAALNPRATKREPMTLEDYHSSPWVIEPFHILDCCLVSNGGVCVIVTSAERARDNQQPPVYLRGFGQGHQHDTGLVEKDYAVCGPGAEVSARALAMADVQLEEITQCQLYDCYTYTVLDTLEDYGFCEKGEGGAFVEDGKLAPGGTLPTNTGGGELSSYYMWGMTPISEAVIQGRGQGGERQVRNDLILTSGNGGMLNYHSTLVLSPEAAA